MAINENFDQIILQTSRQFKEALATYAQQTNTPMSQIVRVSVAQTIGYDLSAEVKPPRKTTYANADERAAAAAERNKVRRLLMKAIQAAVVAGDVDYARHLAETVD